MAEREKDGSAAQETLADEEEGVQQPAAKTHDKLLS
jgi:hypothetical protein